MLLMASQTCFVWIDIRVLFDYYIVGDINMSCGHGSIGLIYVPDFYITHKTYRASNGMILGHDDVIKWNHAGDLRHHGALIRTSL